MDKNYYDILEVDRTASKDDIKTAYKKIAIENGYKKIIIY